MEFTPILWEDMTALQQLQCTYSDAYKDVYGVRPHGDFMLTWTEAELEAAIEQLFSQ